MESVELASCCCCYLERIVESTPVPVQVSGDRSVCARSPKGNEKNMRKEGERKRKRSNCEYGFTLKCTVCETKFQDTILLFANAILTQHVYFILCLLFSHRTSMRNLGSCQPSLGKKSRPKQITVTELSWYKGLRARLTHKESQLRFPSGAKLSAQFLY